MKKGYIGPLGDDFPALFPIILGLVLFFGAVSLTYQIYEMKNAQVNSMRANIMLSRGIRERKHMDWDYWDNYACPLLKTTKVNYGVQAAMRIDISNYTDYDPPGYDFETQPFYFDNPNKNSEPAVCFEGGPLIEFSEWEANVPTAEDTLGRNFVSMTYPVIVNIYDKDDEADEAKKQSLTAELTVVTWT